MPIFTSTQDQDAFIRPIFGLHGEYTLSQGMAIPYFSALVPLDRVIQELRIAEDVSPSLDNTWTLTELFQREIDRDRVLKEIVNGYLRDPNKLKFFNALTVVLLPKSEGGQPLADFEGSEDKSPSIPHDAGDEIDKSWARELDAGNGELAEFGGVQYLRIGDQARLRWDADTIHPVAVDGQHRLAALQLYKDNYELSGVAKRTKIPVLFLLLHERAGFKRQGASQDKSISMLSREIFTDLNKNARRVDRARELILDDWSLEARCCRTLITDATAEDSTEELPLSMVRWQEDNNRFDGSYFLNSLVNLEQITRIVLDVRNPRDPMDIKQVYGFIDSVNEAVGGGEELVAEGRTLREAYKNGYLEDGDTPIAPLIRLPADFLGAAVDGFVRHHKPWLVKLLMEAAPYARLMRKARELGLVTGEFAKYWAQTKRHRHEIVHRMDCGQEWLETSINGSARLIEELKRDHWFYKAAFQKALVRMVKHVCVTFAGDAQLGNIDEVLGFIEWADSRGVFNLNCKPKDIGGWSLWTFIALNPGNGKIKVTKQTEDRIFSVLLCWYYGHRYLKSGGGEKTPAQLLSHFRAKAQTSEWPECDEAVAKLEGAYHLQTFYGDRHDEMSQEAKTKKRRERAALVLRHGCMDE